MSTQFPYPGETLTKRQVEVLQAKADFGTNAKIAKLLGITENTVKGHTTSILVKLEVEHSGPAIAEGFRQGIIS